MRRSFDNIEYRKWNGYYPGYSNLGVVRISGSPGRWSVYMGNSPANCEKGIDGAFVGSFDTLAQVSRDIGRLTMVAHTPEHGAHSTRVYVECKR